MTKETASAIVAIPARVANRLVCSWRLAMSGCQLEPEDAVCLRTKIGRYIATINMDERTDTATIKLTRERWKGGPLSGAALFDIW